MGGTGKYCPICGREVADLSISRFGEYFDSEEHAEAYVKEVRTARIGQAAAAPAEERVQPSRRRGGC